MLYLKQSTASQSVLLGPFVDSTDGVTAETLLTINASDIKLSANGGTMANKTSGGGTHDANGWYAITLDATDTATVGRLQISCVVSGALPVFMECQVVEEAVYDAFFAASATGVPALGALEASIATAQADLDILTGTDGVTLATAQANYAPATVAALATAQTDLDTITGSDGVTLATTQGNYAPAKAGDSMALTAAAVDAVWDETLTAHVTADSAAVHLKDIIADTNELQADDYPTTLATLATSAEIAALDAVVDTVKAETALIVADTNELQTDWANGGRLDNLLDGATAPTAAAVADAVWDEDIVNAHTTADTSGFKLAAAGAAADPWSVTLPASYTTDQAGWVLDRIRSKTNLISGAASLVVPGIAYTEYFVYTSGSTLYGKGLPLDEGTWANDIVSMTEDATTGVYSASFTADTSFIIYKQAGGSPASTDTIIGYVYPTYMVQDADIAAIKAKTDLITANNVAVSSRVLGSRIELYNSEEQSITISTEDYSAKTLKMTFEPRSSTTDTVTVLDGAMTKTTTSVAFAAPSTLTDNVGEYLWSLRDTANDEVLLRGHCIVKYAPLGD